MISQFEDIFIIKIYQQLIIYLKMIEFNLGFMRE